MFAVFLAYAIGEICKLDRARDRLSEIPTFPFLVGELFSRIYLADDTGFVGCRVFHLLDVLEPFDKQLDICIQMSYSQRRRETVRTKRVLKCVGIDDRGFRGIGTCSMLAYHHQYIATAALVCDSQSFL